MKIILIFIILWCSISYGESIKLEDYAIKYVCRKSDYLFLTKVESFRVTDPEGKELNIKDGKLPIYGKLFLNYKVTKVFKGQAYKVGQTFKKTFWLSTQKSNMNEPFDFTVNTESKIWFNFGGTPYPMDLINQKLLEAELKK